MTYICINPGKCHKCQHYKFDPDRMDYSCHIQTDRKEEEKLSFLPKATNLSKTV